jgi:hypothetical protein
MNTMEVKFPEAAGPVYTGRAKGEQLRIRLELDSKEDQVDVVDVTIPEGTYTVSSSFFLGLFGPSIRKCGDLALFERKFHFKAPAFLMSVLREHAALALQSRNLFA